MKRTDKILMALATVALFAAGCTKDAPGGYNGPEGKGDIVVSLKPNNPGGTRSLIGDSDASKIEAFENRVVEFTAYLFDDAGLFLEQGTTASGQTKVTFEGYEGGEVVQVVAFANTAQAGVTLPTLTVGSSTIVDVTTGLDLTVDMATQLPFDPANEDDATRGLLMSGQYGADAQGNGSGTFTVVANTNNLITVPVERVVAKVIMGKIDMGPDLTIGDLVNFQVTSAGVQKVVNESFIYPGEILDIPTGATYYGAYTGGVSVQLTALGDTPGEGFLDIKGAVTGLLTAVKDGVADIFGWNPLNPVELGLITAVEVVVQGAITGIDLLLGGTLTIADELLQVLDLPLNAVTGLLVGDEGVVTLADLLYNPANYWYVLPNDNADEGGVNYAGENPTLLTLMGLYGTDPYYYPVAINSEDGASDTTDGTNIKRNMQYVVNVTFSQLIGSNNPEDPTKATVLTVTVEPIAWEGPINQNYVWE